MLVPDLELLRSFVSVVDAGSFTRAGERVHRTQSTVSQQIQRLEEQFGRPLLHRTGRRVTPTDDGERLLPYARRLLALADETREAMAQSEGLGILRLGIPEDFAARRLSELLSRFFRTHPQLRYDVRCELSVNLQRDIERGELDLAVLKRDAGGGTALASWPENLHWVTSRRHPISWQTDPMPLAVFPQGCQYRNRAIHALESRSCSWRITYTCPNFSGIQAAVSAGLGVSILPESGLRSDHLVLTAKNGFPAIPDTELALVLAPDASGATRRLAELLTAFCAELAEARTLRGLGSRLR
jgi:DNA-binding transcriptional LysR family regulator